jgi:hypothetical protein
MKQYVLDEPMAAAPLPAETQPPSLRQPGRWRWLALAVVVEALVLAILFVALNGAPTSPAASSPGMAYVASFSFPREVQVGQPPAQAKEVPVSAIRQHGGRYVVELHDESPAGALAMLTEATKARVAGTGIFDGSALRLSRSVVATSPREAWQAVFGDVANFAIACAGSLCEVRFVSLAKAGVPLPVADSSPRNLAQVEPPADAAPADAAPAEAAPAPPANGSMARAAAAPPLNESGEPTSSDN